MKRQSRTTMQSTDDSIKKEIIEQHVNNMLDRYRLNTQQSRSTISVLESINSIKQYITKLGGCNLCRDLTDINGQLSNLTIIKPNKCDKLKDIINYLICPCGFMKIMSTLETHEVGDIHSTVYQPYYYSIYSKLYLDNCYRRFINVNMFKYIDEQNMYKYSLFSKVIEKLERMTNVISIDALYDINEIMDLEDNRSRYNSIKLDFSRFKKINEFNVTDRNIYYVMHYLMDGTKSRQLNLNKTPHDGRHEDRHENNYKRVRSL